MIGAAITYIVKFIPLLLSTLITFFSLVPATHARLEEEIGFRLTILLRLKKIMPTAKLHP